MASPMRKLGVVALACAFVGCATTPVELPPAAISFLTEPEGGTVLIVEADTRVAHGETAKLAAGSYTCKAEKPGHDSASSVLTVKDGEERSAVLALGTGRRPVTFETLPRGGTIREESTGLVFGDGSEALMPAGVHQFSASKAGYASVDKTVTLTPGVKPEKIVFAFGQGYGVLTLETRPAGGAIKIEGVDEAAKHGHSVRLPAGTYTLTGSLAGFAGGAPVKTEVVAGEEKRVVVPLGQGSGDVHISTGDGRASIFFGGEEYTEGDAVIKGVPFGDYEAKGFYRLNESTRLTGTKSFTVNSTDVTEVHIELTLLERIYENEWVKWSRSLEREEADYLKVRTAKPVVVEWSPPQSLLSQLRADPDLEAKLHALLRIGDRLIILADGKQWFIWKRAAKLQAEFQAAVRSFVTGEPYATPYELHDGLAISTAAGSLASLAFDIHLGRVDFPVAHLAAALLPENGCALPRSTKDGEVFVLVLGGQGVSVETRQRTPVSFDKLTCCLVEAGDGPIRVAWTKAPDALLAVCEADTPELKGIEGLCLDGNDGVVLMRNQKAIFQMAEGLDVHSKTRYTLGPDGKWRTESFNKGSSFVSEEKLSQGELGPHFQPGAYATMWLIQWANGAALSQRQVQAEYRVNDVSGGEEGTLFLRRN